VHTLLLLDPGNFHAALRYGRRRRARPTRSSSTPAGARSVGTSSRSWSGSTGALRRPPAGVPPSYGDGLDYRGHAELAYRIGPVTAHARTRWERAPGPGGGDAPGRPRDACRYPSGATPAHGPSSPRVHGDPRRAPRYEVSLSPSLDL